MSKFLEIMILALGGLSLFVVAFMGFAASAGVPLDEVAVVGPLFSLRAVETEPAAEDADAEDEPDVRIRPALTDLEVLQSNLGVIASYRLPAPYSGEELAELVDELKAQRYALDQREQSLDDRETRVTEREETSALQLQALEDMRLRLNEEAQRLEARAAEVNRDEAAQMERETSVWQTRAELFSDGDPEELVGRLMQFSPEDAGRILRKVGPERAKELLAAVPERQWKSYADAYANGVD